MSTFRESYFYVKGLDLELDRAYSEYKRTRVFAGDAWTHVLSANEKDCMVKYWKKERTLPKKLSVHEVKKLIDFSRKIVEHRKLVKKEDARIRKVMSRTRLSNAAKSREADTIKTQMFKKEGIRIKSKTNRKRKQIRKAKEGAKKIPESAINEANRIRKKKSQKRRVTKIALKEANRIRKEKSRKRLRIAAEIGECKAVKKLAAQKEKNRIRSKNYRKRKQEDQAARRKVNRSRKEKSRQRLLNAVERGDIAAVKKREAQKEANRIRSQDYRKRKREQKQ